MAVSSTTKDREMGYLRGLCVIKTSDSALMRKKISHNARALGKEKKGVIYSEKGRKYQKLGRNVVYQVLLAIRNLEGVRI